MRVTRRDTGLTLLELVLAMALFALVSVMGLQALTGVMRAQGRLTELAARTAEMAETLALVRSDLRGMVPVPFAPPGGGLDSSFAVDGAGRSLALTVSGQINLADLGAPALQRVIWRLDPGRAVLTRQVWPTTQPAAAAQASPQVVMLEGVTDLGVEAFLEEAGWQPVRPTPASEVSTAVPIGVRLTLTTRDLGRLVVTETIR